METNELQAGRELDALIAEKVFGAVRTGETGYRWVDAIRVAWEPTLTFPGRKSSDLAPDYSTDIAAACQVVEKLRERFEEIGIHWIERAKEWSVEIYYLDDEGKVGHANATTAPLAICHAALKAVSK